MSKHRKLPKLSVVFRRGDIIAQEASASAFDILRPNVPLRVFLFHVVRVIKRKGQHRRYKIAPVELPDRVRTLVGKEVEQFRLATDTEARSLAARTLVA